MCDLKQQNNLASFIEKLHAKCKTTIVNLAYIQVKSGKGSEQSIVDIQEHMQLFLWLAKTIVLTQC